MRTLYMSLSLFLQKCPECLVRQTWMVLGMGGRCPYSCCFVWWYFENLFHTARSILVQLPSSFFSIVSIYVVHPYSSMDMTVARKNCVLFYWTGLTSICYEHSIYIEHWNPEKRKTRNDFLVRYETFYYLWVKGFDIRKRDAKSFYDDFSICPPNTCGTRHKATGLASASKRKPTVFSRGRTQLNWLFQNPPNPPRASDAWRHTHSLAPFSIWAIVTSLGDSSAPPARVNTCVNVASK